MQSKCSKPLRLLGLWVWIAKHSSTGGKIQVKKTQQHKATLMCGVEGVTWPTPKKACCTRQNEAAFTKTLTKTKIKQTTWQRFKLKWANDTLQLLVSETNRRQEISRSCSSIGWCVQVTNAVTAVTISDCQGHTYTKLHSSVWWRRLGGRIQCISFIYMCVFFVEVVFQKWSKQPNTT